ncbi:Vanillate O-demethylase oxidoreductase [Hydrogenophaga crassostreae]|uniref:Oxidoreductase n=1 Tax=Hydrogenophaga crassostreae TaxID=1763535 RepID=A0A167HD49_9BURK|nr:PDR/VanB family oxidoreductase [Hydrogenophaga crassostreae]AOW12049.1 oxidoreductase [Hydrogenophaga crassostreae]OAD40993.1 Vanillate O-demethylase oxidoreductase [Hydrogenophaga crassostreae]
MNSTRLVRIAQTAVEAVDICSFELVAADGQALPPFSAGSHIDVHLDNGVVRQYSLCNAPGESHRYQIAVLKDAQSRGGSVAMHALEAGQSLNISDPKNHFALDKSAQHSLLFAGGIGITPILCMAERLSHLGASFEMHYCTRSAERTAFVDRIRASAFADNVHLHHDEGAGAQKLDAQAAIGAPRDGIHLYVCGPTGYMDWVLNTARELGWPDERLHREYFAAAPIDTSQDGSFEVQIASTGAVIRVAAEQSVVAALSEAGIEVQMSCEQGVCGTCLTRVLEGTPAHRDMFLTPREQARGDQFLPCCSRAESARLVLDL